MRRPLRRLIRHPFAGPVLTLIGGGAAAQAAVFVARPLLTRLYSPEAFGALGVFTALAYLLATLLTLRYEDALMLPARRRSAAGVLVLALGAAGVLGGAALLALGAYGPARLAARLGVPGVAALLWMAPLVAVLLAWANAAQGWLARAERFRLISGALALQSAGLLTVQISAWRYGAAGLVLGVLCGAALFAGAALLGATSAGAWRYARHARLRRLATRYRRFAFYGTPATLLAQLASRLPPLLLAPAFGAAVVGQFGLAVAALAVPLGLVGDATGQVFYVRAAEAHRAGRLAALTASVLRRLAHVATYPVLAAALAGPDVFAFVFGEPWREAGLYARLLAPWLLLSAINPPLTRVFDTLERQRDELALGAVTATLLAGALLAGSATGDARTAILLLGLGGGLARAVQLGRILTVAQVPAGEGVRALVTPLGPALPGVLTGAAALAAGLPGLAVFLLAAGGAYYYRRLLRAGAAPVAQDAPGRADTAVRESSGT
ncbi:MAG: lipopolysaccharide biosynthesis protein [Rubricoccaceae bacterium]